MTLRWTGSFLKNRSQGENEVFGNSENDSLHWDLTMAELLKNNSEEYAQYSDYDSKYEEEYNKDIENLDKLGNDTTYIYKICIIQCIIYQIIMRGIKLLMFQNIGEFVLV